MAECRRHARFCNVVVFVVLFFLVLLHFSVPVSARRLLFYSGRDSSTLAHDESQLDDEDIGIFTLQDHLNFLKERARQRSTHQAVRLGSAISVEPDQAATGGGGAGGRQLVYMDDYSSCTASYWTTYLTHRTYFFKEGYQGET
ncbi:unnamed protein product [Sphagnum balticum]